MPHVYKKAIKKKWVHNLTFSLCASEWKKISISQLLNILFLMRSLGAYKLWGDLDIYPTLCFHPCSLTSLGFWV